MVNRIEWSNNCGRIEGYIEGDSLPVIVLTKEVRGTDGEEVWLVCYSSCLPVDANKARLAIECMSEAINSAIGPYGCHCDLEEGEPPDDCVIDSGRHSDCDHAKPGMRKEECEWWRPIR